MSFWSWLTGASPSGITPNANVPTPPPGTVSEPDWSPGDPDGVEFDTTPTYSRSLPIPSPSPWSGWPSGWSMPRWDFGSRFNELVDVAWTCLDLNASVLSAMPVYRTRSGVVVEPVSWMANPDPSIYTSWHEFAKQLFWDYMTGEAFVLPVTRGFDGYPLTFRVVPPWMIHVELKSGVRQYRLGGIAGTDVSDEILHIRYQSSTDNAHGVGPLTVAGGRMLTAGILAKYVRNVVETGGLSAQTLESPLDLSPDDAQDLLNQWVTSRAANLGYPPVLDNDTKLVDHHTMSPKDMAMLEIAEFTEARIAVLLGVPPYLIALGQGGDSTPYANVSQVFDFHDRASLKTKATHVMAAVSWWALPSTQRAEVNRDEYTRPPFAERADAWVKLVAAGIVSPDEVRTAERFTGPAPVLAVTGDTAPQMEGVSV